MIIFKWEAVISCQVCLTNRYDIIITMKYRFRRICFMQMIRLSRLIFLWHTPKENNNNNFQFIIDFLCSRMQLISYVYQSIECYSSEAKPETFAEESTTFHSPRIPYVFRMRIQTQFGRRPISFSKQSAVNQPRCAWLCSCGPLSTVLIWRFGVMQFFSSILKTSKSVHPLMLDVESYASEKKQRLLSIATKWNHEKWQRKDPINAKLNWHQKMNAYFQGSARVRPNLCDPNTEWYVICTS